MIAPLNCLASISFKPCKLASRRSALSKRAPLTRALLKLPPLNTVLRKSTSLKSASEKSRLSNSHLRKENPRRNVPTSSVSLKVTPNDAAPLKLEPVNLQLVNETMPRRQFCQSLLFRSEFSNVPSLSIADLNFTFAPLHPFQVVASSFVAVKSVSVRLQRSKYESHKSRRLRSAFDKSTLENHKGFFR